MNVRRLVILLMLVLAIAIVQTPSVSASPCGGLAGVPQCVWDAAGCTGSFDPFYLGGYYDCLWTSIGP